MNREYWGRWMQMWKTGCFGVCGSLGAGSGTGLLRVRRETLLNVWKPLINLTGK